MLELEGAVINLLELAWNIWFIGIPGTLPQIVPHLHTFLAERWKTSEPTCAGHLHDQQVVSSEIHAIKLPSKENGG